MFQRSSRGRPLNAPGSAIDGIIDEANEIAGEIDDKMVLNAALIAAAQAVEHYEITRYGTLVTWAKLLGHSDVARVLNLNLKEEKATDKKLNVIAKRKINRKAAARQRKRPGRLERTQDALMEAAAGIPGLVPIDGVRQDFANFAGGKSGVAHVLNVSHFADDVACRIRRSATLLRWK
jgi:hypothetical protein